MSKAAKHGLWPQAEFEPDATGALDGLVVVDLSRLVAGNMASLQLADFGAEVIKVEPLPAGDPLRAWQTEGVSTYWKVYGRNKRSLALDFRADGAAALLRRLCARADVFIESFRPGRLEEMGLAPEALMADNPGLVILRVSGFGQTGPYSGRPGFGTVIEAMSGFAARSGEPGGDPLLPPMPLADMVAGLSGAFAVLAALRARDASGRGQAIDLSLLEPLVSILGPEAADFALTGAAKARVGNASNTSSPRNVYRTRDGAHIALSASIQQMAERLFRLIGRDDMIGDPRYRTNADRLARRDEIDAIVGDWIGRHGRDEVMAKFEDAGITAAPVYDIADIARDPQFADRGVYVEAPDDALGRIAMHAPVPRLAETPGALRRPAPALGADTREVLERAGFAGEEIDRALESALVAEGKGRT